jgi:hypothetical protein
MRMIFDVEPMLQWFGPIDDKDFPTEYTIKDFRVWRQPGYTPPAPPPAPPAKTPAP